MLKNAVRGAMTVSTFTILLSGFATGCGNASSTSTTSGQVGATSNTSNNTSATNSSSSTTNQSSAGTSGETTTITMYSSGDVNVQQLWQNDLIPIFEKTHPDIKVKLVFSEHGDTDTTTLAKLAASVKAKQNFSFDLIDSGIISQAAQSNLLQTLNTTEVPRLSTVDPQLLKQNKNEGLPYRGSAVVLAYDSTHVSNPPKTLDDLIAWIKANPGKFTYNSPSTGGSGEAFVNAMVNQYVPKSDQSTMVSGYNTSLESYWDKGFQQMKSLQPDIYRKGFYPNGNAAVIQLLGSSSIWMAPVWSDQALSDLAQKQLPSTVKLTQLQPPLSGGPADLGVPISSPHKAQADTFLNWVLKPSVQEIIMTKMDGFPGIQWKYIPSNLQKQFSSVATSYNLGYSSQFNSDLNSQWSTKVAGGH